MQNIFLIIFEYCEIISLTCSILFSSSDIHPILMISTCSPFSTTNLSPVKHWNFAMHVSLTAFAWHGEHLHFNTPSPDKNKQFVIQ